MSCKTANSWNRRVFKGDLLWEQVATILQETKLELRETPRFPDIRLILNNVSGHNQLFRNPGKHAGEAAESIPPSGEKTAAMVMLHGDTLAKQFENAKKLVKKYKLDKEGLSRTFIQALQSGKALDLVKEAYGPAPFQKQSKDLNDVTWQNADGSKTIIKPVKNDLCAYGARAKQSEKAFRTQIVMALAGTGTSAEYLDCEGIVVAVDEDWDTKKVSTRPIKPGPALDFYGVNYNTMPVAYATPEGDVIGLDLGNGKCIERVIDFQETNKLSFLG